MEFDHVVWLVAGFFTAGATIVSAVLMFFHLRNYTKPEEQKWILRTLLIVPVYAVDSLLSIIFREWSIYFTTLRTCYESYVLYAFFQLLIAYVGGFQELALVLSVQEPRRQPIPLCCLPKFQPGMKFLRLCRQGVLQYVIVNVLCAIATFILQLLHKFEEGNFAPNRGYLYIMIITNISITISMWCLVLFYLVCKNKLAHANPVSKFICIKAVIFFSFWQSVLVAALVKFDVIPALPNWGWTQDEVAKGMQDFLICLEMFIAAIAHHWAFPYKRYQSDEGKTSLLPGVRGVLNMQDIGTDTIELFVPTRIHHNLPPRLRSTIRGQWIQVEIQHNPHQPINRNTDETDDSETVGKTSESIFDQSLLVRSEMERKQIEPPAKQTSARETQYGALADSDHESDGDDAAVHKHRGGTQSHYVFRKAMESDGVDVTVASELTSITVVPTDNTQSITSQTAAVVTTASAPTVTSPQQIRLYTDTLAMRGSRAPIRVVAGKRQQKHKHKRQDDRITTDIITPEQTAVLVAAMKQATRIPDSAARAFDSQEQTSSDESGPDDDTYILSDELAVSLAGDTAPLVVTSPTAQNTDQSIDIHISQHAEEPSSDITNVNTTMKNSDITQSS